MALVKFFGYKNILNEFYDFLYIFGCPNQELSVFFCLLSTHVLLGAYYLADIADFHLFCAGILVGKH